MEDRDTRRGYADTADGMASAEMVDPEAALEEPASPEEASLAPHDAIVLERLRQYPPGDILEARTLRGRPVVDLSEGRRVGSIADVVLDTSGERIVGFQMSGSGAFSGQGFLPLHRVHAIGEDAVTIDHGELAEPPLGREAARATVGLRALSGKRVFTEGGDRVGSVEDAVMARPDGRLVAYALDVPGALGPRAYLLWTRGLRVGEDVIVIPEDAADFLLRDEGGIETTWQEWTARLIGGGSLDTDRNPAGEPDADERTDNEFSYVIGHVTRRDVVVDGRVVVPERKEVTAADAAAAVAAGALEDLALAVGAGDPSKINIHGRPDEVTPEGETVHRPGESSETGPVMRGPAIESGTPVSEAEAERNEGPAGP